MKPSIKSLNIAALAIVATTLPFAEGILKNGLLEIFLLMPVTQRGICPRLKGEVIDAKLGYPKEPGEPLLMFAFEPLWPEGRRKGVRRGRSNLANAAIRHELSQMIS